MKKILELPIRKTLITITVVFLIYLALSMISLYLSRLEFAMYPDDNFSRSKMSPIMHISQLIAGDLGLLSRLVLETAIILLIAQGFNRIVRKYKRS